ncbi:MAG: hypothetical protein WD872_16285 [Pirellulaceae bacterium]
MKNYFVQSGPLKITIVAESAYDAALEAVRWWDEGLVPTAKGADHRANLDAAIEVRPSRGSRMSRMYPTFSLLARSAGESPAQAWERILRQKSEQLN